MIGSGTRDTVAALLQTLPSSREATRTFAVGLCIGAADAVPGVSGGTIALIAGVYERLVDALSALSASNVGSLAGALFSSGTSSPDASAADGPDSSTVDGPEGVIAICSRMDVWFLLTLLVGMFTAVAVLSRAVTHLNDAHPVALFGFFFGLIGVSAALLFRDVPIDTPATAASAVAGFAVAFLVAGQSVAVASTGLLVTFGAGAIAFSAMLLPGLSGSLLLILLGQYTRLTESLSLFIDGVLALPRGGSRTAIVEPGTEVAVFLLGGFLGLLTVSRVVRRALDAHREVTLAFLVALIAGALRAPIERVGVRTEFTVEVLLAFGAAAAVGGGLLLALDRYVFTVTVEDA